MERVSISVLIAVLGIVSLGLQASADTDSINPINMGFNCSADNSAVTVSWTNPDVNSLEQYFVYRSESASSIGDVINPLGSAQNWLNQDDAGTRMSYTDSDIASGTRYYYSVKLTTVSGGASNALTEFITCGSTDLSPFDYPDLTITKIIRNPSAGYIGSEFTANVYVKNIGGVDADVSGSHITLLFGPDLDQLKNNCGSDCYNVDGVYYGYYDIGEQITSLAKNEVKAFRFESTVFNGDLKPIKAGTHYLYAQVDVNDAIDEARDSYNNNTYTDSFNVVNRESPFDGSTSVTDKKLEDIDTKARQLKNGDLDSILSELKALRDTVKEQTNEIKYLHKLTSGLQQVTEVMEERINNFITYGVDDNTKRLGEGERAAVLHSYKSAFDKLPNTEEELADAIKIANGRWPSERSEQAEETAKAEFRRVYLREANMDNPNDNAAVTVMAYGLRQRAENRNLGSERAGIGIFEAIYKHVPSTTEEWNIMQAITYSGTKR